MPVPKAGHFTDFQKLAAAVTQASQVYDQVDRRSQLSPDGRQGQIHAHKDHGLQPCQHIPGAVGVAC